MCTVKYISCINQEQTAVQVAGPTLTLWTPGQLGSCINLAFPRFMAELPEWKHYHLEIHTLYLRIAILYKEVVTV